MRELKDCHKYLCDFPKLSKSNSFIHQGRVILVISKQYDGTDNPKMKVQGKQKTTYSAYDYKTKTYLRWSPTKDELIEYIKQQDLKVLNELD